MIYPKITLTMTTCQRLNLFTYTIESFFKYCQDIDLIDEMIIVDDNSSTKDVMQMKLLLDDYKIKYQIIEKPIEKKGHANSMNMLWCLVKTDYIIHLEDDWQFIVKDSYIRKAFDIMNDDYEIKQVLFRTNDEIMSIKQDRKTTKNNIDYIKYKYDIYSKDKLNRPAWSGWNLNPSLMNLKEIKEKIGMFNNINGFEYNYSMRFAAASMKTSYFLGNYCQHIGKNNSAYILNDTAR